MGKFDSIKQDLRGDTATVNPNSTSLTNRLLESKARIRDEKVARAQEVFGHKNTAPIAEQKAYIKSPNNIAPATAPINISEDFIGQTDTRRQLEIPQNQEDLPIEAPILDKPEEDLAPADLQIDLDNAAIKHGLPKGLFTALAKQESNFDNTAISQTGVQGVLQVTKKTGKEMFEGTGVEFDVTNQDHQIEAGAKYLAKHIKGWKAKGFSEQQSQHLATASYNTGFGRVSNAIAATGKKHPNMQEIEDAGIELFKQRWDTRDASSDKEKPSGKRRTTKKQSALNSFKEGMGHWKKIHYQDGELKDYTTTDVPTAGVPPIEIPPAKPTEVVTAGGKPPVMPIKEARQDLDQLQQEFKDLEEDKARQESEAKVLAQRAEYQKAAEERSKPSLSPSDITTPGGIAKAIQQGDTEVLKDKVQKKVPIDSLSGKGDFAPGSTATVGRQYLDANLDSVMDNVPRPAPIYESTEEPVKETESIPELVEESPKVEAEKPEVKQFREDPIVDKIEPSPPAPVKSGDYDNDETPPKLVEKPSKLEPIPKDVIPSGTGALGLLDTDPAIKKAAKELTALTPLENTSPVVERYGTASKHEDGTWSVLTREGVPISGLSEIYAKAFHDYNLANWEANPDAPQDGSAKEYFNRTMAGLAFPAKLLASAFARNEKDLANISEMAESYEKYFPVNRKHAAGAVTALKLIAEKEGTTNALKYAFDNMGIFMEQGFDSIGFTIALAVGNVPVQIGMLTSLSLGKSRTMKQEWIKANPGLELTPEIERRIEISSAFSMLAEKVSVSYMKGVLTGKPLINNPIEWMNKVGASINKSLNANLGAKAANLLLVKPVTKFVLPAAGEGVQETMSRFAEKYGETGEKLGKGEVVESFVGGALAGPTIQATVAATLLSKAVIDKALEPSKATKNKEFLEDSLTAHNLKLNQISAEERISDLDRQIADLSVEVVDVPGGVDSANKRFEEIYNDLRSREDGIRSKDAIAEAKVILANELNHLKGEREQLAKDTMSLKIKDDPSLSQDTNNKLVVVNKQIADLKKSETKDPEALAKLEQTKKTLEEKLETKLNKQQLEYVRKQLVEQKARIERALGGDLKDTKTAASTMTEGKGTKLAAGEEAVLLKEIEVIAKAEDPGMAPIETGEDLSLDVENDYVPEEDSGLERVQETKDGKVISNIIQLKKEPKEWLDKEGRRLTEKDFKDPVAYQKFLNETKQFDANKKKGLNKLAELRQAQFAELTPEDVNPFRQQLLVKKLADISKRDLNEEQKTVFRNKVADLKTEGILPSDGAKKDSQADKLFSGPDAFVDAQNATTEQIKAVLNDPDTDADTKEHFREIAKANRDKKTLEKELERKEFADVHEEIVSGESKRFKGLHAYRDEILEILKNPKKRAERLVQQQFDTAFAAMQTHATNLNNKLTAFKLAYDNALTKDLEAGKLWAVSGVIDPEAKKTNPNTRKMQYTVSKMTRTDFNKEVEERRGAGGISFLTEISSTKQTDTDLNSQNLINVLQQEVNLGSSALKSIETYDKSSIAKNEQRKAQKGVLDSQFLSALDEIETEIGAPPVTPISDETIDSLKDPQKKDKEPTVTPTAEQKASTDNIAEIKAKLEEAKAKLAAAEDAKKNTLGSAPDAEINRLAEEVKKLEKQLADAEAAKQSAKGKESEGADPLSGEASKDAKSSTDSAEQGADTTGETGEGAKTKAGKVQDFITSAVKKYWPVITSIAKGNKEKVLGMFGAFFTDLVQIGEIDDIQNLPGLHTLKDTDFIWTDEDIEAGRIRKPQKLVGTFSWEKLKDALIDLGVDKTTAKYVATKYKVFRERYENIAWTGKDLKVGQEVRIQGDANTYTITSITEGKASLKGMAEPMPVERLFDARNYALREPLSLLLRNDENDKTNSVGKLPDQILLGMYLSVLSFKIRNPTNNRFTSEWQKKQFLYSGKEDLKPDDERELVGLGYSFNDTADSFGKDTAAMLRMSAKQIAEDHPTLTQASADLYYSRLLPALGMMAIDIAAGTDSGAWFTIENKEWKFDEYKSQRNYNNTGDGKNYRHIKFPETTDQNGNIKTPLMSTEGKSAFENIIDQLGIETEQYGEVLREPIDVSTRIKRSLKKVPRKVIKALKKLHNAKWNVSETLESVAILNEGHRGILNRLMGVLPTEGAKVKIVSETPNAKKYARDNPNTAVYVMRVKEKEDIPHVKPEEHFGNPWSAEGYTGLDFKTNSIPEAVNNYREWLAGRAHQGVEPKRREWIRKKINEGFLNNKELVYFKSGYKSHADVLAEFVPADMHQRQRDKNEAANRDKNNDLDAILEADKEGKLKDFYFGYELQGHHRVLQQGKINPQHSKVTRFLLQSWGAQTYNKDNLWKFKLAVVQNFGLDVDKNNMAYAETEFDHIINNGNVQEAVKAMQVLKEDKNNKEAANKLAEALSEIKSTKEYKDVNIQLVTAITALTNYMPSGNPLSLKTEFKSDIVMEIDGITNGFAMNLLQFPMFKDEQLKKHLNQVGNWFDVRSLHDPSKPDVYMNLIEHIKVGATNDTALSWYIENSWKNDFIKEAGEYTKGTKRKPLTPKQQKENDATIKAYEALYGNRSKALEDLAPDMHLYDKGMRKTVKYPFMIYMYGGGTKSIAQGVASDIVDSLYEQATDLHNMHQDMQNNRLSPEARKHLHALGMKTTKEFADSIDKFVDNLDKLGAFEGNKSPSKEEYRQLLLDGKALDVDKSGKALYSFNDSELVKVIGRTVEPRFEHGLNSMLGDTKNARSSVIKMGQMMHRMFMLRYERAYKNKLKQVNEEYKAKLSDEDKRNFVEVDRLTDQQVQQMISGVNAELSEVIPQAAGPLAQMLKNKKGEEYTDGALDLSSIETVRTEDKTQDPNEPWNTEKLEIRSDKIENKIKQEDGTQFNRDIMAKQLQFVESGVSVLIRQIQNMDSVILTQTFGGGNGKGDPRINVGFTSNAWQGDGNVLPLHDAFMASPEQLSRISEIYGKTYIEYNKKYSIIETTLKQVKKIKDTLTEEQVNELNNWYYKEEQQQEKQNPKDADDFIKEFEKETDQVIKAREKLFAEMKARGMVSHQLYMPQPGTSPSTQSRNDAALNEVDSAINGDLPQGERPVLPFNDEKGKPVKVNDDQWRAMAQMEAWWGTDISDINNKIFVLQGRGGTGKTTIVEAALTNLGLNMEPDEKGKLINNPELGQVKFALPTHKAKQVIQQAAGKYKDDDFDTIAGLLGEKPEFVSSTDKAGNVVWKAVFKKDPTAANKQKDALEGVKVIVIDEASMVNEKQTKQLIAIAEELGIRLLFMGDNVQLPPIEKFGKGTVDVAMVFDTVMEINQKDKVPINIKAHYAKLDERMRQDAGNPILGVTDILANVAEWFHKHHTIYKKEFGKNSDVNFQLPFINNDNVTYKETHQVKLPGEKYKQHFPTDSTITEFAEEYKKAKEAKNEKGVKYIHFNAGDHVRSMKLRAKIRKAIFGEADPGLNEKGKFIKEFLKGERLVIDESTSLLNGQTVESYTKKLKNGDEVTVHKELETITYASYKDGKDNEYTGEKAPVYENITVNVLEVKLDGNDTPFKLVLKHDKSEADIQREMMRKRRYGELISVDELTKKFSKSQPGRTIFTNLSASEIASDPSLLTGYKEYKEGKIAKEMFTEGLGAAYIINSHKAQGSTYDTVYADYENILRGFHGSDFLTRVKALYVATSRPRTRLVLVGSSGQGKKLSFGTGVKNTDKKSERYNEDLFDANQKIKDDIEKGVTPFLDDEISKKVTDTVGSIDDLPKVPTAKPEDLGSITEGNFMKLFNKFKAFSTQYYADAQEMLGHTETLDTVLGILSEGITEIGGIKLTKQEVDGITQGEYDIANKAMTINLSNGAPFNVNQSPQEVYVHELLHATTALAIRENPLIADRVHRVYLQTKRALDSKYGKNLGYKVFLEGIDNPSKNDTAMAEKQYNYVFAGKEKNRLHEFLAYSATNRQIINFLKTQPKPVREGILDNIIGIIASVMNFLKSSFGSRTYAAKSDNAFAEILAATEHLVATQAKHESMLDRLSAYTYNNLDKSDKFIKRTGEDILLKIQGKEGENTGILRQTALTVGGGLYGILNTGEKDSNFNRVSLALREKIDQGLNKTMRGIASEIGDGALTKEMIEQLLYVKVNISKARQQAETFTMSWFNGNKEEGIEGIWKSVKEGDKHGIDAKTKVALTRVLFQTDLSVLLNEGNEWEMSPSEIMDLIGHTGKARRDTLKARIATELKLSHKSDPLSYAKELGYWIATGNTRLDDSHTNVRTIAAKYFTNPTTAEINLLDMYSTLSALDYTDTTHNKAVLKLAKAEFGANFERNGISDLLKSHRTYKQNVRAENFEENEMQLVKGYIVERIDNFTHIRMGRADQKKEMKQLGYSESYPVTKIDGSQTIDTMYVTRTTPEVTDVSGVMSTTNQRNMGTTLTEILVRDPAYHHTKGPNKGKPDFYKIQAKVEKFIKAKSRSAKANTNNVWNDDLTMRPLRDQAGNITDYRVMMNHADVEQIIRPDLEIDHVFAHMRSSAVDRKETIESDKKTVELLVYEQMDMMKTNPGLHWIDIMDPNSPYIDRYRKLPKAVRDHMNEYAIGGQFFIREDIIDKVFGYKSFDLSELKMLQDEDTKSKRIIKRVAGVTHHAIKQTVGYGKNRVVIAMPKVVIGNMMSNIYQLMMRKIPLDYIFHKIYEGIHEYNKYRKDTERRITLKHEIESQNLDTVTSPEAIEMSQLDDRIKGNLIHRMSKAGLNSLIVEDINDAQTDGWLNKLQKTIPYSFPKAQKFIDKMPSELGDAARFVFMTKGSKPYQYARHVVQLTDFLARYVMIEHGTKVKGRPFNDVMHESLDGFVVFDEALVPALEALEAVGATSFLSYYLRNARSSRKLAASSPTGVALAAAVQHTTGISALGNVNSSWLAGRFSPNMLQTDDLFDEANNVTLFDIVKNEGRDLFN